MSLPNAKILVLIGTKAQFVKMAPVLLDMDERSVPYSLVYTGQHSETFEDLEAAFGTRRPDSVLISAFEADTHLSFAGWTIRFWIHAMKTKFRNIWREHDILVVHGDTASTLYGAIIGRLFQKKVAHIEAGLRSPKLGDPFPEELIRRLVSKLATLHYCPDDWACSNLRGVSGTLVNTHGNTLLDSLQMALDRLPDAPLEMNNNDKAPDYGIVSMHRNENLSQKKRFETLMKTILQVSEMIPIKFVMHSTTRKKLQRTGWLKKLSACENIQLLNRMDYFDFIALLTHSTFLLTDGGSNQEEAAQLGIPCLLLRNSTERKDGLSSNVELSRLEPERIRSFVAQHRSSTWDRIIHHDNQIPPSRVITESLREQLGKL